MMSHSFENRVQELGKRLLARAREEQEFLRKRHHAEFALLDWCMQNNELKTRVFRFIDVYPSLHSPGQILSHIREYFSESEHRLPVALRAGVFLTRPALLTQGTVARVTDSLYRRIARLFIGAETPDEAARRLKEHESRGCRLSVDLLGERTTSGKDADDYEKRYEELILALGSLRLDEDRQNISVKLSALDPQFDPLDTEGTSRRVRERLSRLVSLAKTQKVFLHIDMEDYESRDLTLKIIEDLTGQPEFRDGIHIGIVLQAYLKDAEACYVSLMKWAAGLEIPLTVRLVRGAYWDTEMMKAEAFHWPEPVFTKKEETDWMFEHLTARLVADIPRIRLAVATHNIRSLAYAAALAEKKNVSHPDFETQILYGMGDSLIPALCEMGRPPRIYMPAGDPVTGMAYLVRRLLENVSSQSFVRRGIHDREKAQDILQPPGELPMGEEKKKSERSSGAYHPAPLLEFHHETVRRTFQSEMDRLPAEFGCSIPVMIGGDRRTDRRSAKECVSPLDGKTVLAKALTATPRDAREAVESAARSFDLWRLTPVAERAACLKKAARWMLARRAKLAALEIFEVGKPWREADADVVEAIDYLNFYAYYAERLMRETDTERMTQETNRLLARPRGVCAVIAPWNFPIAILTGMSSAALVTGNPVILKPAEQSLYCGWMVYEAYRAAGIPDGVVHFLPGIGEEIGPELVNHPETAIIAFTGSKEVGLGILRAASEGKPRPALVKKCIVEMGGKNAVIVDSTADFDAAIPAVLQSAFGFAGQKCSALSRLIVAEDIYKSFVRRLTDAAQSFCVGNPLDPAVHCGPVIDREAFDRIQAVIRQGKQEGKMLFQAEFSGAGLKDGYYVPPVILGDLPADSKLLREEIFGPVLCVMRARNFEEALQLANRTDYALTGGVFSRTPSHIEKAKEGFEAGNLYINRGITGAVVGRQPFGGFKLSGGGTKAGSADYLREFFIRRTVSEDVSRHGFAPSAY